MENQVQVTEIVDDDKNNIKKDNAKEKLSKWLKLSILSLFCGCFTLFKGIHKLCFYDSGDRYPYEPVNAYVGGDAYNFIINGTYATSYFVLTTMFVLAAIGLVLVHYVAKQKELK